jgi:hypothetical protein
VKADEEGGQSAPVSPPDESWEVILACVDACFSQLDNILAVFIENIRDGQKLFVTFNQKPSWQCQVQESLLILAVRY